MLAGVAAQHTYSSVAHRIEPLNILLQLFSTEFTFHSTLEMFNLSGALKACFGFHLGHFRPALATFFVPVDNVTGTPARNVVLGS